jgi:excisionase family DNA binding protein
MENMNEFLTVTDITKLFDLSRQAVDAWLKNGRVNFYRLGNTRRVRAEDLIKYLENLGNSLMAMTGFKRDINNYLWLKYRNKKYLKEAERQSELFRKYNEQREKALAK